MHEFEQSSDNDESEGSCSESYYNHEGIDGFKALKLLLDDIASLGLFVTAYPIKPLKGPGLHIASLGHIALPLTSEQQEILQQTSQLTTAQDCDNIWQLEPSQLAATNPDWQGVVKKLLCQASCLYLGVCERIRVSTQPRLRKVILKQDGNQYESSLGLDTAPGTFATMVVSPLSEGMEVLVSVCHGAETKSIELKGTEKENDIIAFIAFYSGCTFELQPGKNGCCLAMVYDLIQHTSLPAHVKDRSWFLSHLEAIVAGNMEYLAWSGESTGYERYIYVLDKRYDKYAVEDVTRLSAEHEQMASILHQAERQGLLKVYLAQIRGKYDRDADSTWGSAEHYRLGIKDPHRQICNWRRLDGCDPEWKPTPIMCADKQWERQAPKGALPADRQTQKEEQERCRTTSLANLQLPEDRRPHQTAFVMWLPHNHWRVFCLQDLDVCVETLDKLIAEVLTAEAADGYGVSTSVPQEGRSAEAHSEVADLRQDVSSLIEGIWKRFQHTDFCQGEADSKHRIQGFDSFASAACAFDQPDIAVLSFERKFEKKLLNEDSARSLLHAAALLGWEALYPTLRKMAKRKDHNVTGDTFAHQVQACEGLLLLLGSGHRPAWEVAAKAAKALADANGNRHKPDLQCLAEVQPVILEKSEHSTFALRRRQIVTFTKIFQHLAEQAQPDPQARALMPILETWHHNMVVGYLMLPTRFPIAQVLGPASLEVLASLTSSEVSSASQPHAVGRSTVHSHVAACSTKPLNTQFTTLFSDIPEVLKRCVQASQTRPAAARASVAAQLPVHAGSPAIIQLMTACLCTPLQQQEAFQQPPGHTLDHWSLCDCEHCTVLTTFLGHPEQDSLSMPLSKEAAEHVKQGIWYIDDCQHNLKDADAQTLTFQKEGFQERQDRFQLAVSIVAKVQEAVQQAIVALFMLSGRPPPEDHRTASKELPPEPEQPQVKLYNLWH